MTDSADAYWVTSTGSPGTYSIVRVPLDGSASTTLATSPLNQIVAIARDDNNLYWEEDFGAAQPGSIKKVPLGGGTPTTVYGSDSIYFVGGLSVASGEAIFGAIAPGDASQLFKVSTSGGTPVVLTDFADFATSPHNIIADTNNVYWFDNSSINSIPIAGGIATPLSSGAFSPTALQVNENSILWSETTCCTVPPPGRIKSLPFAGGPVTVLSDGLNDPGALTLDSGNVYWSEGVVYGDLEGFGRVASVPIGGGATNTLISGVQSNLAPIAVDEANVYVADRWTVKKVPIGGGQIEQLAIAGSYIRSIVTDGTSVYWSEDPTSNVAKVPVIGGAPASLGGGSGPAGPVVVVGKSVYWMDSFATIKQVSTNGGMVTLIATGLPFLSDLTVDNTFAYVSEHDSGEIDRIPLGGGSLVGLAYAGHPFLRTNLALDDSHLYWIDQAGDIGKVPKAGGTQEFLGFALPSDLANSVAVGNGAIFWTDASAGTINSAPASLTTPTTITAIPSRLNFGKVDATVTSKFKELTLKNTGAHPAEIGQVVVPLSFTFRNDMCSNAILEPKAKCTIEVAFAPASPVGSVRKALAIAYNGPSSAETLDGVGLAVALSAPRSISFASVARGSASKPKNVKITNESSATVQMRAIVSPPNFQISSDGCSGSPLAPKGVCMVAAEFTPGLDTNGERSVALSFPFTYGLNSGSVSSTLKGKVRP